MNELIKITETVIGNETVNAVNARDLWESLESKRDFSTWIKSRIEKYEFIEGTDYLLHKFVEQLPSGAKHCIDYIITLDMAKELAMVENNARGRMVRRYFILVEKQYRQNLENTDMIIRKLVNEIRRHADAQIQRDIAGLRKVVADYLRDAGYTIDGALLASLPLTGDADSPALRKQCIDRLIRRMVEPKLIASVELRLGE